MPFVKKKLHIIRKFERFCICLYYYIYNYLYFLFLFCFKDADITTDITTDIITDIWDDNTVSFNVGRIHKIKAKIGRRTYFKWGEKRRKKE